MAKEMIRLEKLGKVFPGKTPVVALADIDLTINEGEIFGIIGLSGAGKSTLVRCINFLERPTSGTVAVNGRRLDLLNEKELLEARRSIGMIFQQFNLLMQRNALGNVCFPLELAGFGKAEAKRRASELLSLVGLSEKENAFPAQLSGGQKQRVAIARALAASPKVLLCDEATSALDPTTTRSILALLKDINKNLGITVVVITHEMSVIEEICSRVAIIDESRIVETGAVEEIFARPKTKAARRLIFPQEHNPATFKSGKRLRIVFDGNATVEPIIGNMVLECGAPVNILRADMKSIGGKTFGQMLVELPDNEQTVHRMRMYLSAHGVQFEEGEEV